MLGNSFSANQGEIRTREIHTPHDLIVTICQHIHTVQLLNESLVRSLPLFLCKQAFIHRIATGYLVR